jgi:hypothetical protein
MKEREEVLLKQIQQEWEVAYSQYWVKLLTELERKWHLCVQTLGLVYRTNGMSSVVWLLRFYWWLSTFHVVVCAVHTQAHSVKELIKDNMEVMYQSQRSNGRQKHRSWASSTSSAGDSTPSHVHLPHWLHTIPHKDIAIPDADVGTILWLNKVPIHTSGKAWASYGQSGSCSSRACAQANLQEVGSEGCYKAGVAGMVKLHTLTHGQNGGRLGSSG